METDMSWRDRFDAQLGENAETVAFRTWEKLDECKAFISTERQRVIEEMRGLAEGMKKQRPLKDGNEPYPSFTMGKVDGHNQAIDDLLSALKEMEEQWKGEA